MLSFWYAGLQRALHWPTTNKAAVHPCAECKARGTNAAGIVYNSGSGIHVYKRPGPAHKLRLYIPNDAKVILGHTRMTTQGSEAKNYNNHPFLGRAGGLRFTLAHNGVLHNDLSLRRSLKLPKTKIETDSYIAVQLVEQKKTLDLASLKYMAEQAEGSFTFTVLDERDCWYLVKGDNPMCLLHFPRSGFYLYASTEDILRKALKKMKLNSEKPKRVEVNCGDILRIDPDGAVVRSAFDASSFCWSWPFASCSSFRYDRREARRSRDGELHPRGEHATTYCRGRVRSPARAGRYSPGPPAC